MAIKTFSQITQSMTDQLRLRQPALDTKPGSVSRDLVIDNTADQLAAIYREIQLFSRTQSLLNATGKTLDQFGSNFNIIRDTGKLAAGTAILTFTTLLNNINITSGTTITSKTGAVFRVTANITISAATKGIYSSFASSIATQLHIAGISDQYAVQVPIEAVNVGVNGNIPIYSLIKTSIPGITNVTNIAPTTGGTNPQGDSQYRNQIIAGLSGSSAGTARGYQNALSVVSGIQSVLVASPGNPILTRDGTVAERNADGSLFVITPGTGGKVDIWIQGSNLINITESYIFHDISGTGNVANLLNAHILGQTTTTESLTPIERRQLFTQSGQLPQQPVDSIISISGSVSGANFVNGVNFILIKDTNPETNNTAFALDKITFLSNFASLVGENVSKGNSNSVDGLTFGNLKAINRVHQSLIITNDLAQIDNNDHTKLTISHSPLNTVLRATNLTTGERYVITDQNLDSTTGINQSGQISISGSVLPSSHDLIQVDYNWNYEYDAGIDYFSLNGLSPVNNAIDWGQSNFISTESGLLIRNGDRYNVSCSRNIERVFSAFYCDTQTTTVQQASDLDQNNINKAVRQITITTGTGPVIYFVMPGVNLISLGITAGDRLHISSDTAGTLRNGVYTIVVVIDQTTIQIQPVVPSLVAESGNATVEIRDSEDLTVLMAPTTVFGLVSMADETLDLINVVSVKSQITGLELFATPKGGIFSGNTIYLATDVNQPALGEPVIAFFNAHEIFNIAKNNGSISNNTIILSSDDVLDFNSVLGTLNDIFNNVSTNSILVNYIITDADVVIRTPISLMPFIGSTISSTLVDKNNTTLDSEQLIEFDANNHIIRSGPSNLVFTIDGAFNSGGSFSIRGTGWFKITDTIIISQSNINGNFDLSSLITTYVGNISDNFSVVKVSSAILDGIPLSINGYLLNSITYDEGIAAQSSGISPTSVDLSSIFTQNGLSFFTNGSALTITFYVLAPKTAETIQFTTGRGTLYSRYKYTRIDRIDLISGFINPSNSIITGNLRISRSSQPITSSQYLADYSYFAPVENERITVQYRYNNIINDATNAIENVRTLTADVLTRLAFAIQINVSATIILTNQAINQSSQIIDQAISAVSNLISSAVMGSVLDYSSLLRVITAINGTQGADITIFDFVGSEFGGTANRKSIQADPNQYFIPNTIIITPGNR